MNNFHKNQFSVSRLFSIVIFFSLYFSSLKGSDASWKDDNEPPDKVLFYPVRPCSLMINGCIVSMFGTVNSGPVIILNSAIRKTQYLNGNIGKEIFIPLFILTSLEF